MARSARKTIHPGGDMMGVRVAVAMSGGVDSSVACLLLKRKGFDVVGLTMKLLAEPTEDALVPQAPCCSADMASDARRVCESLGIPHYTLNMVSEFEEGVVLPFVSDYAAGRTPNPCLLCNRVMKFGHLLRKAREIGASFVATGHYARAGRMEGMGSGDSARFVDNCDIALSAERGISGHGERTLLLRGMDKAKDQSYALYALTQDELSHALFPLGGLTKKEVRRIAKAAGLRTAEKPESQEICFVTRGYRAFLHERGVVPEPGPMLDTSGKVVGRHIGIPFYTIGQRRGLGVPSRAPLYVVGFDLERNAVIVGNREEAMSSACVVRDLNLIASASLDSTVRGTCMVRYRGAEVVATMRPLDPGRPGGAGEGSEARIDFETPQFAVTPGQAAVLYQGDVVFGGGTIAAGLR